MFMFQLEVISPHSAPPALLSFLLHSCYHSIFFSLFFLISFFLIFFFSFLFFLWASTSPEILSFGFTWLFLLALAFRFHPLFLGQQLLTERRTMVQNSLGVSERANKRSGARKRGKRVVQSKRTCERCERTSKWTSKWPSIYVLILGLSKPPCALQGL